MRKNSVMILAFGILFLFFIQAAGSLVESIYILDLLHTRLDEKALGLLFFFTPVLLLPFRKKVPRWLVWLSFDLLIIARGLTPSLNTAGRMLTSGIATFAALMLFAIFASASPKGGARRDTGLWVSAGLALAAGLSVLLRTLNYGLDYSLTLSGSWVGWALGLFFGYLLSRMEWKEPAPASPRSGGWTAPIFGLFMVVALIYFAFSAPAVIARWTEGNYALIVTLVSLGCAAWLWVMLYRPDLPARLPSSALLAWNILFTLVLTATIWANTVAFPSAPDSAAVVVSAPSLFQQVLLILMLILFPVIFLDARLLAARFEQGLPTPAAIVPGLLVSSLALVLLVFMQIFSNVWAYVEPVSPMFRNKFWLPYLLMAAALALLVGLKRSPAADPGQPAAEKPGPGWAFGTGAIFLACLLAVFWPARIVNAEPGKTSLVVMTYNIQQANDRDGERSYEQQLALMKKVSPDVISLQETDSARVSLNNNDYVRYYAAKLGYYSYYGPKTVTGTFGTAILSRYPLQNTRTAFSFSDGDEIGTVEAEIEVGGRILTVYDVHPDGSELAFRAFANTLLQRSKDKPYVIALGDYNQRDYDAAYKLIASVYTNAWVSVYPTRISPDGVDMSGKNRIDHIFFSNSLVASDPVYILPPASATDHPVHWATISWK